MLCVYPLIMGSLPACQGAHHQTCMACTLRLAQLQLCIAGREPAGSQACWPYSPPRSVPWQQQHSLQAWFGIDTFLSLEPMSYSKRVLDDIQVAALHLTHAQKPGLLGKQADTHATARTAGKIPQS